MLLIFSWQTVLSIEYNKKIKENEGTVMNLSCDFLCEYAIELSIQY